MTVMITTKKLKPNEVLGINPLTVADFVVKVNNISFSNSFKKSGDEWIPATNLVEYETSAKLFNKSDNRKFISALPPSAKDLFLWLLYEIELNKDYIKINHKRFMIENGIKSINTYKTAIETLTRYCIIYPVANMKGFYWINPKFMFNGSRINKYPDKLQIVYNSEV